MKKLFLFEGAVLACIGLSVAGHAQSYVGVNTRYGFVSNSTFGPGTNLLLTNSQYTNLTTTGGYTEIPLDAGRGVGLFVTAMNTNPGTTNTLSLFIDSSPLGSTNKTFVGGSSLLGGVNTNLTNAFVGSNYTGMTSNGVPVNTNDFYTWTSPALAGNEAATWFVPLQFTNFDNARFVRVTALSNNCSTANNASNGYLTVSNILWTKFP